MRLVFITRKVDRNDPLTGFIFGWIEALAKNLDRLYVICQELGDASRLPGNVEVHSFGKERGYGKLRQLVKFSIFNFQFSKKVDGIFVHMHPVYAIAAWPLAKLFREKMVLWYTHKSVDMKLKIAHRLVDEVLTASKESFRLASNKVQIVGHGIDLEKFAPLPQSLPAGLGGKAGGEKFRIISIGRISPVKDYETLIKAIDILVNEKRITNFDVQIYGNIGLPEHQAYLDSLVKFAENAGLDEVIDFQAGVAYDFVPGLLQEADLLVNLSETGSLDKNVLEAAASGRLVLTSNEAFIEPLAKISPDLIFSRNNPPDLTEKIIKLMNLTDEKRAELKDKLRGWVEREHDLQHLAKRIVEEFR